VTRVLGLQKKERRLAAVFIGALWVASYAMLVYHRHDYQWDFQVYYFAAKAWAQNLNPYEVESLKTAGAKPDQDSPFLYPPITLPIFRLFTVVSYEAARNIWLALKLLGVLGLVLLWRRTFLRGVDWLVLLPVVLMSFNGATLADLETGNITVFEQLILWMGFWCYLRGRRSWFVLLVVLGSVWKLTSIVLLLMLVLPRECRKRGWVPLAIGLASFALVVFVPFFLRPDQLRSFLASSRSVQIDTGPADPCMFALFTFVSHHFLSTRFPTVAIPVGYAAWALFVVYVLRKSWHPLRGALEQNGRFAALLYALFLYSLISPRFMCYSYMLLIVPATLVLYGLPGSAATVSTLLLPLCLPSNNFHIRTFSLISDYYPLLLTLGAWYLLVTGRVDLHKAAQVTGTEGG